MKHLTFLLIALIPTVAALGWVTTPGSDVDTEYLADNYMPLNPHTFTNVLRIAGQPSPSTGANLELRAGIHTGVGAYGDIVFRAGSIRAYNTNHLSVAGGFPHEGGVDAGHLILRGGQAYAGGANGIIKLGSRIDGQGHSVSNVTQIHADQFIATSQLSVDNIVLDRSGTAARFKNPLWAWGDIRAFGDYLRAGDQDFGTGQGHLWLRDSANDGDGIMRFYDGNVQISWDLEHTWSNIVNEGLFAEKAIYQHENGTATVAATILRLPQTPMADTTAGTIFGDGRDVVISGGHASGNVPHPNLILRGGRRTFTGAPQPGRVDVDPNYMFRANIAEVNTLSGTSVNSNDGSERDILIRTGFGSGGTSGVIRLRQSTHASHATTPYYGIILENNTLVTGELSAASLTLGTNSIAVSDYGDLLVNGTRPNQIRASAWTHPNMANHITSFALTAGVANNSAVSTTVDPIANATELSRVEIYVEIAEANGTLAQLETFRLTVSETSYSGVSPSYTLIAATDLEDMPVVVTGTTDGINWIRTEYNTPVPLSDLSLRTGVVQPRLIINHYAGQNLTNVTASAQMWFR